MALLLEEHPLVVEPSGAAVVAALLQSDVRAFSHVVLVLTGRNIAAGQYLSLVRAARPEASGTVARGVRTGTDTLTLALSQGERESPRASSGRVASRPPPSHRGG